MPRKRVIYQSEALFVGSTGYQGDPIEIQRVQSANYSFEITRQDINEFGKLARVDSIILEQPTVSLDFTYFPLDGTAESALGFTVSASGTPASAISGMLNGTTDTKNYYIYTASEGNDAQGFAGTPSLIGIGNASMSSYSVEGSVGEMLKATVNVEGLNIAFASGNTMTGVTIDPTNGNVVTGISETITGVSASRGAVACLRPGDITMILSDPSLGLVNSDLKIQSFNLSFDLSREPLQKLGSKFAFSREIEFPVTVSLSVEALMGDLEADNLANLVSNDSAQFDTTIKVSAPGTTGMALGFALKKAKLDSQEFSSSIGDNKTVSLQLSAQLGGPQDLNGGLFIYNGF